MPVIELPGFIREAITIFSDSERAELIGFLAANPEAGELMAGTGGGRKLRWRAPGRGKRGGVRVVYYYHNESLPLFLISVFPKNEKANLTKGGTERDESATSPFGCRVAEKDEDVTKEQVKAKQPTAGSRILADLREAVAWAEGGNATVRISTVDVPVVEVKATRLSLGLSQAAFAAKFGFQAATLRNWEQGRTHPDGPARVLLAVIAKHPEAVEDALHKAS